MTNQTLEDQIIGLIAVDRIEIPISSMSGKLKRRKPVIAGEIEMPESGKYNGERVYARVESENKDKARTMKEAVAEFAEKYPREGKVLQGMIAEKRLQKEEHLYFGMTEGSRLTSADYMAVMTDLGFSEARAESLYAELMDVSRNLSKKRGKPERSILIGKCYGSADEDSTE